MIGLFIDTCVITFAISLTLIILYNIPRWYRVLMVKIDLWRWFR